MQRNSQQCLILGRCGAELKVFRSWKWLNTNLAVQSEENNHDKETTGPQRREGH